MVTVVVKAMVTVELTAAVMVLTPLAVMGAVILKIP